MRLDDKARGFTLVEIVIVAGLMVFMSSVLIKNFGSRRFNFDFLTNNVVSDVRTAQSYALNSKMTNNAFRCGFGINRVSTTSYRIYAGRDTSTDNCTPSYTFINSVTTPDVQIVNLDNRVQILPFEDVFFLPPDPRIYIGIGSSPTIIPLLITLKLASASDCSTQSNCRFVCVYPSGRIEAYKDSALCI